MKINILTLCIVFLLSTCKKDEGIYTTINAVVPAPATVDTTFSMIIVPNPCDRSANVQMHFPRASSLKISVYDVVGRLVYTPDVSMQLAAGANSIGIATDSLQSGMYIVIAERDGGSMASKMLVHH